MDQADVGYIDPFMLASSLDQLQVLDSRSSSTEHADPPAIESVVVSSETSDSSMFRPAAHRILGYSPRFIPQTPTHTPIQQAETGQGAGMPNGEVPHLDLDAATEDLNRINLGAAEEYHIVPEEDNYHLPEEGRGPPAVGSYQMRQTVNVESIAPDLPHRIHLALPNPGNLATVEVVMTVPYERGRDPVNLTVALPPRNSPIARDNDRLLQFEVKREPEASTENSKAVRFVKQLPRLDLVDMPELQDHPCCICREPYMLSSHPVSEHEEEHETPVRLPCKHVVGERCLTMWLHTYHRTSRTFNTKCPLCRQELPVHRASDIFHLPEGVKREPHGVSQGEFDRISYRQIVMANQRFGQGWREVIRDEELAAELTLPDSLPRNPGNESVRSVFEGLQLKGAFRPPYVTGEYRAYGNRSDKDVYDGLKAEGAHWTTRWGMLSLDFLTVLLRRLKHGFISTQSPKD